MANPAAKSRAAAKKTPIMEVVAEDGDHVEPPPPEVLEPEPDMSPEEAEQARKDYLLTRFWISARGFWGKNGDRLAWILSIGLLILIVANVGLQYGINVWNRAIFDALERRDSATVYYLSAVFFPDRKSTRLNSSHLVISYAVFCLKKKKHKLHRRAARHRQ